MSPIGQSITQFKRPKLAIEPSNRQFQQPPFRIRETIQVLKLKSQIGSQAHRIKKFKATPQPVPLVYTQGGVKSNGQAKKLTPLNSSRGVL